LVTRNPYPGRVQIGGFDTPPARDLLVILGVLLATYAFRFFESTLLVPLLLQLSPAVWQRGFVWQAVTYPFIGAPVGPIGFLFALFMIYQFGQDVYLGLYRRHFWRLIVWSSFGAALVAIAIQLLLVLLGQEIAQPFAIMQGQWMLLAIFTAAFATAHREATIYLFFILPIPARWLIGLEVLFAFMAFLFSRDFPGFLGICSAVGLSYVYVRSRRLIGGKGGLREMRLRLERWWIQRKLDRERRKRGFRVIPGDRGRNVRKGPWVN